MPAQRMKAVARPWSVLRFPTLHVVYGASSGCIAPPLKVHLLFVISRWPARAAVSMTQADQAIQPVVALSSSVPAVEALRAHPR